MGVYLNERQIDSTKEMERKARKRKGSFINGPPNKRFRKNYVGFRAGSCLTAKRRNFKKGKHKFRRSSRPATVHVILWAFFKQQIQSHAYKRSIKDIEMRAKKQTDTQWETPVCSGTLALQMLILGAQRSYMKEALGLYQYFNTCVPDTLLASFHILSIKYLHVEALLRSDDLFRVLMKTLNEEKYNYARALWIRELDDFNKLNRFSNIKDHFPIIDKLVCAKVDYHQKSPEDHPIYEKTLSKFRPFGDLRALGDIWDPSLVLVYRDVHNPRYDPCMPSIPPLAVIDDNKR
ncbi:uncharacterized protein LOC131355295 isoform X1 [Hemibagrus wyckioides]|nr:uncharacterized protein LOC131355295 isoform X1 [Hemibagrus wyckioides]